MQTYGLIPARLASSRLPNKALLDIHGYPMIVHTAKRAQRASKLDRVVVGTDSKSIYEVCAEHDIEVMMTSEAHQNGTDRIAEMVTKLECADDDVIIDVQGDEPLVDPDHIDRVAEVTINSTADVVVPYQYLEKDSLTKPKIVESNGKILYMSRAQVPYPFRPSDQYQMKSQLCIIGFKPDALKKYASVAPTHLETLEGIELIRALELGLSLETFHLPGESLSVDVYEDYVKILKLATPVKY